MGSGTMMRRTLVTLMATLGLGAGCGSPEEAGPGRRERVEAELAATKARVQELGDRVSREAAAAQAEWVAKDLAGLRSAMKTLDERLVAAEAGLAAATSEDARERAAARVAEVQASRTELQQRIDKLSGSAKPPCPPDKPGC